MPDQLNEAQGPCESDTVPPGCIAGYSQSGGTIY